MLYALSHHTVYQYPSPASVSHHLVHLRPRESARQHLLEFALEVDPAPAAAVERTDYFGNATSFIAVEVPHRGLSITARSRVRVIAPIWPDPGATPAWEMARDGDSSTALASDGRPGEFLFDSQHVVSQPALADYAAESFRPGCPLLEGVVDLNGRIFRDFTFDPRATTISTPVAEVFKKRRGVCQDFAHLGISCLRSLGLAARYVSGYLETVPPPGKRRLVGADASHAWFSVWCPGHGWIDADPTNNLLPAERHITVAWGRDYSDVSPVRGVVVGGGEHRLKVGVDVARIEEPPAAIAATQVAPSADSGNYF
ncbi:MAG: hypothetical protein QOE70_1455 [Chthoniobacter sp.]|nr:hypothetical protein [Chthoniobacter sp.]